VPPQRRLGIADQHAVTPPLVQQLRGGLGRFGQLQPHDVVVVAAQQRLAVGRRDHVVGRRDDLVQREAIGVVAQRSQRLQGGACDGVGHRCRSV
jgi:hypothetical protein